MDIEDERIREQESRDYWQYVMEDWKGTGCLIVSILILTPIVFFL